MPKKIKALTADPRWEKFCLAYAFDPTRFAIEVCGLQVTWQQIDLFDSLAPFGSRTTVSSGHGTGKTRALATGALWHLLCYADSNTYLTAPKLATLQEGVWKELSTIKEHIETGPHAWIAEYFEIKAKKVYVKGASMRWFIMCRTAPRGSPEGMAGTHNNYLLWMADEASGIPDPNLKVISGALTDARNRWIMCSQPTRSSGFFYETHHGLSADNDGPWNNMVMNSEESPIVSDNFIADKILEYGGKESTEYQVKVQGRFPENSDRYLLGRGAIERRIDAPRVIGENEPYGNLLLVDVGAGMYRDKTVAVHARVIGFGGPEALEPRRMDVMDIPIYSPGLDWTEAAGRVCAHDRGMTEATRFYREIRQFASTRKAWQDAIRYETQPDEAWDLTLVSERVYGTRNEALAVLAAAGLDRFDQELIQRRITLPTAVQLEAFKQMTGYSSTTSVAVR